MRALLIAAAMLAACGTMHTDTRALYPGDSETQRAFRDVCGYEGALCATAEQMRAIGAGKAVEGIWWGRYIWVGGDVARKIYPKAPSIPVRVGIATVEGYRCERQPLVCRGVLRHEIAHKRGSSQSESDCYAMRMGTPEERDSYEGLVATFKDTERFEALLECKR